MKIEHEEPKEEERFKKNVASQVADIACEQYIFLRDEDGATYAAHKDCPHVALPMDTNKGSLVNQLSRAYRHIYKNVPSSQAIKDCLVALNGEAEVTEPQKVYLRAAKGLDGATYLDLADKENLAVKITSSGWRVTSDVAGFRFKRVKSTYELPVPVRDVSDNPMRQLIRAKEEDWALIEAWLITALNPDWECPIFTVSGEQGTGKTTVCALVRAVLDPTGDKPVLSNPPRDERALVSRAVHYYILGFDNVSYLAPSMQDDLCKVVTGAAMESRALYSDAGLASYKIMRPIILNGIDLGRINGDLAARMLKIRLEPISPENQLPAAQIPEIFKQMHAEILGYLMDLMVEVLAELERNERKPLARMGDFSLVLQAIDEIKGTQGFQRYREQLTEFALDSLNSEPFISAITEQLNQPFIGTAKQLLNTIIKPQEIRANKWPDNPTQVAGLLRRHSPNLRRAGWHIPVGTRRKDNTTIWELTPPNKEDHGKQLPQLPKSPGELLQKQGSKGLQGHISPSLVSVCPKHNCQLGEEGECTKCLQGS